MNVMDIINFPEEHSRPTDRFVLYCEEADWTSSVLTRDEVARHLADAECGPHSVTLVRETADA